MPASTTRTPSSPVSRIGEVYASNNGEKARAPRTGRAFGGWAPDDPWVDILPKLNSLVQFDLDMLTLDDFAVMRNHPQVNSSISTLTFMQHQSPWEIVCDDEKIRVACEDQMREIWTTLNRSMGQANWAGYSPGVLQWENDIDGKSVVLHKILDLRPNDCEVNWKEVKGAKQGDSIAPKFKIYDGIKQIGAPHPIPVENTFWYPILMENGNYYGRKLLQAAFTPWYFSILIHLYANRYHERFGEPIPVGRAPFDNQEDLTIPLGNGATAVMTAHEYMLSMMDRMRNRASIVLPSEGTHDSSGKFRYEYMLEFIDSQMRGADFDRYLNRLDEEITLALFTPVLLMRTADVGSYNLGTSHMQVYLWMMNAMNADRKQYIDRYILSPLVDYNYGIKAPRARIKFRQLGQQDAEVIKAIVTGMFNSGQAKANVKELGQIIGLTVEEVDQTLQTPAQQAQGQTPVVKKKVSANAAEVTEKAARLTANNLHESFSDTSDAPFWNYASIIKRIRERIKPQVEKIYRTKAWDSSLDFGYQAQVTACLRENEVQDPVQTGILYSSCIGEWAKVVLQQEAFPNAEAFILNFTEYATNLFEARINPQ